MSATEAMPIMTEFAPILIATITMQISAHRETVAMTAMQIPSTIYFKITALVSALSMPALPTEETRTTMAFAPMLIATIIIRSLAIRAMLAMMEIH